MSTQQVERAKAVFSPYVFLTPPTAVPTPISSTPPKMLTPEQSERLIYFGNILATLLAHVLDRLTADNEQAVYPIMSILEPYMVTTAGMDFSFPPKSSRKVIVEVTRKGRVQPTIYFDE